MARLKQGINGPATGTIGPTVHYIMYGKHYARSLLDIRNYKNTPKRLTHQQRIALVQAFLKPFKELIRISFAPLSQGSAPYHVAKFYNLLKAIKGEAYPDQSIDLSKTLLSAGPVILPSDISVVRNDKGLYFQWTKEEGSPSDTLLVLLYQPEYVNVQYRFTGFERYQQNYFWEIEPADSGIHI
jgi:hypothetical protein